MADILVSGVPSITLAGKPKSSSAAYAVAECIGYAFPYQYDLLALSSALQTQYNTNAELSIDNIQDALLRNGVKFLNLQPLVDAFAQSGNSDELRHELSAEERQGLIHLIILKDDSKLALAVPLQQPDASGNIAVDGTQLHPWSKGVPYALVRVGFSDSSPWGYYKDPILALSLYASEDIADPTPILWSTIASKCGIAAIIGVLPGSITQAPPVDFRYYGGVDAFGNEVYNVWPPVVPALDVTSAIQSLEALRSANQQAITANQQIVNSLQAILPQIQQEQQRVAAQDSAFLAILAILNG